MYKKVLESAKLPNLLKANTYLGLGAAHEGLGEHGDAIECFRNALSLYFDYYGKENKEFIDIYTNIGNNYAHNKEYDKAIENYKKVIDLEQNTENVFIAMTCIGEAFYKAKRFQESKAAFERSLDYLKQEGLSEPEYPEAYEYCIKNIKLCRETIKKIEEEKKVNAYEPGR